MEMVVNSQIVCSVFIFFIVFQGVCCIDKNRIVNTKQGQVEGLLSLNEQFYEFCGIRYGVAKNRFMAPEEPPQYDDVYTADVNAVVCAQFNSNDVLSVPSENEDCLVLNIFVPSFINTTMPVMFFIHGGDFGVGSSSPYFYGPQFLVSHGLIVVTANYRLNAFGFLNLGIKEAPGNAGLKDIRAALRWVRDNIENFGGDKDNVTVFGHGSGGAAAIYLTLSKSCEGLFKRIISQSGTMFSPKSFDPKPLITASQVAKSLGVILTDPNDLLNIYINVPINKLEEAIGNQMNAKSVFVPSVEEYLDEDPFLTDTPFNILNSANFKAVPALIGLNTIEGLTCTLDYNTITSQIDRIKNEDYSCLDQRNLNTTYDKKTHEEFQTIIKDTYFNRLNGDDDSIVGALINFNTDFNIVGPMALFADLYANVSDGNLYQYIFNYMGNRNLGRILTNTSLPATTYMDELFYLFEIHRVPLPLYEDDIRIMAFMTLMWTNFAKYGIPTPDPDNGEWLPYPHQLSINLEPQYVSPLTPDRAFFFLTLYSKYGAELEWAPQFKH